MKNAKKENIEVIENTLKKLDINYHKPLIKLLNEYLKKLNTQENYVPLINSLINKIPICILENKLKVPNEVNELMKTLNLALYKIKVCF